MRMRNALISLDNLRFAIWRHIMRRVISRSPCPRPASTPYISGDTFRALATHVYDEANPSIDVSAVRDGDVIFVATHFVQPFFEHLHPDIKARYKLITHNSDFAVDETMAKFIDDKIITWFAQNTTCGHPKITSIPIGLENLHYYNCGITQVFDRLHDLKSVTNKKKRILVGFNVRTNPAEREPAQLYFSQHPNADNISVKMNSPRYQECLSTYMFVASPLGHGIDTHRTWEAMYLAVVPIVKRSYTTEFFRGIGAPLWIIDEWEELGSENESSLWKRYNSIIQETRPEVLYMDYWTKMITDKPLHWSSATESKNRTIIGSRV
jgi:hypothetical protein